MMESSVKKLVLVGNPNVGKSVIFGHLTGTYVTVSNYPGTTVEVARGRGKFTADTVEVVDTPGAHSLSPQSEDERVTRDVIFSEQPDFILQVGDAKNLARNLYFSLQLAELGLPFALALNMADEATRRGIKIDVMKFAQLMPVRAFQTVAVRGEGLEHIAEAYAAARPVIHDITYHPDIEKTITVMTEGMPAVIGKMRARGLAVAFLSEQSFLGSLEAWLGKTLSVAQLAHWQAQRAGCAQKFKDPLSYIIAQRRHEAASDIADDVVSSATAAQAGFAKKLGEWSIHPVGGFLILALVLLVAYEFVGVLGAGVAVDFLENTVFGKYISPWATRLLSGLEGHGFLAQHLHDLIVGDYGIITMGLSYALAIILPIVTTFFIAFSILEDSGYLPRLAMMINQLFKQIGLNGKAVLPMVLGLGCDTMATLTARIMETRKERILVTLLLALGVPCSAQLGVILGMLGQIPLWAGVTWIGTVVFVLGLVGWLAARVLPGSSSEFILEVPPIRRPKFKNILSKTLARVEWYLKEAVPLFIYGTLFLYFLNALGWLEKIQDFFAPLVTGWLGLPVEATEAFLIGFLRRDFGATHFFDLYLKGRLSVDQTLVAMIVITLFVPCIANVLIIIKERGWKTAAAIVGFIFPFAFFVGGVVRWLLR